jgi:hypothetical protein
MGRLDLRHVRAFVAAYGERPAFGRNSRMSGALIVLAKGGVIVDNITHSSTAS